MLCGDFNINQSEENVLANMLRDKHFKQIVDKPTTYRGKCIDHFYHNVPEKEKTIQFKLHKLYYSDHAAICVNVKDA